MAVPQTIADMTVRACPLCDSTGQKTIGRIAAATFCGINSTYTSAFPEILGISPESLFPLGECDSCGFVFAEWLPDPLFLSRVYSEVIDPLKSLRESNRPGWVAHQLALGVALLEHLEEVFGDDLHLKILDFGCGFGTLVRALAGPNVTCVGFESGRRQVEYLSRNNLAHHASLAAVDNDAPYHGVILSDVLEHVPHPREVLRQCRRWLAPGGLLCVSVPTFEREMLREQLRRAVQGQDFARTLNPWEHLNYFSVESLRTIIVSEGFRLRPTSGTVDVGFRSSHTSALKRWGNSFKSLIRLIKHTVRMPASVGTTCIAQRKELGISM